MNKTYHSRLTAANATPPMFHEMTLDDVAKVLSLTIKDDDVNKKTIFLAMLSAYTESGQINISINAPSSTGKTYLATQIAKLFPDEDKVELSGASPTSFFYGEGVFDEVRKAKIVSLKRKILIFYEQPDPLLQAKLRSLLSHDSREVHYALTNKTKGRNQVDKVIIEGFPSTIFCSAGMRLDEQEATRAILISPEATQAKINRAVSLQFKRGSDEEKFKRWLSTRPDRIALMDRIIAIRDEQVGEIIIPNPEELEKRFREMLPTLLPRHSRDSDHFQQLIKAITLLNVWYRRQPDGTIVANDFDIQQAFELWESFFDTQNLNLPPAVLTIYRKYIIPAYIHKYSRFGQDIKTLMRMDKVGLSPQELINFHTDIEGTMMNTENLRKHILPQLESVGLIQYEQPAVGDKRTRHIFPLQLTEAQRIKVGRGGVGNEQESLDNRW